jgi:hypothetical protein
MRRETDGEWVWGGAEEVPIKRGCVWLQILFEEIACSVESEDIPCASMVSTGMVVHNNRSRRAFCEYGKTVGGCVCVWKRLMVGGCVVHSAGNGRSGDDDGSWSQCDRYGARAVWNRRYM